MTKAELKQIFVEIYHDKSRHNQYFEIEGTRYIFVSSRNEIRKVHGNQQLIVGCFIYLDRFVWAEGEGELTIAEMRKKAGMTQKAFSEYLHIPKRTIENWEAGKNQCPDYVRELIEYRLEHEGMLG